MLKTAIVIILIIVLVLFFVFSKKTEPNLDAHLDFAKQLVVNENGVDPQDEGVVGERKILFSYVSEKYDRLVTFIEEPWMSGTGGSAGYTIISNIDGSEPKELDVFLTASMIPKETMEVSSDERYLLYATISGTGGCFAGSPHVIDLVNNTHIDLQAPYEERFEEGAYDQINIEPTRWIYDNTVSFTEPGSYCIENFETRPVFETWLYDISTGEYTLINE